MQSRRAGKARRIGRVKNARPFAHRALGFAGGKILKEAFWRNACPGLEDPLKMLGR